ncbi:MAG TPA: hypothetical protein VH092_35265 [Urbifossiella sp.]|nr:hypothetical protein [Urbifossiella sp.]
MPFALYAPKGKGFADRGVLVNRLTTADDGRQQLKQLRGGYLGPGDAGSVDRTVRTHNVIEDRRQRPTTDVGEVYSYEAIAPGVVLRGTILARPGLLPPDAPKRFSGPVRLGSSKKDDYGEAALAVFPEAGPGAPPTEADGLFVWLLSDVLLRDDALRPDPIVAALGRELGTQLGVTLSAPKAFARRFDLPTHYPRTGREPNPNGEMYEWFVANERQRCLALPDLTKQPNPGLLFLT